MTRFVALFALFAAATVLLLPASGAASSGSGSTASGASRTCKIVLPLCTDPSEPINDLAGGPYVGHDEPSILFYDHRHGSGNDVTYNIRLPKEPPTQPTQDSANGVYWSFEQRAAYWFGMIMCDTQSSPEFQHKNCKPDSDSNIFTSTDPKSPHYIGKAPGNAYMELQFYPPGWVPQFTGFDCPGTKWCVSLTIDSLNIDQNAGVANNDACANLVGLEPVNWAYLTRNGKPHAPPDPISLVTNADTGNPNPSTDLQMNAGDRLQLHMFDTPQGFRVVLTDLTSHQTGSMTASAANGFEQVLFQPNSNKCNEKPYSFHPEFDTSTKDTRSSWADHTYNVAGSDEIGHFEYCDTVDTSTFTCANSSTDPPTAGEPDEDFPCFPASFSSLVPVSGCLAIFGDLDFDGPAYSPAGWAGNSTAAHDAASDPEPIQFMTPTIHGTKDPFGQVAFETDTPSFEAECNVDTGVGCTSQPLEAQFYPIYTAGNLIGGGSFGGHPGPGGPPGPGGHPGPGGPHGPGAVCVWQFGGPNYTGTTNAFGGTANAEYGAPFASVFPDPGPKADVAFTTTHRDLSGNPCSK